MAGVKAASLERLEGLSWLPDEVAQAVYAKLHGSGSAPRQPVPFTGGETGAMPT